MKKEPRIIHILADGKKVKSIDGHIIPANNVAYNVILDAAKKRGTSWQQSAC